MSAAGKIKDVLDWARRAQFVYQIGALLASASVGTGVRTALSHASRIAPAWRPPIYLLAAAMSLFLLALLGEWWTDRKKSTSENPREVLEDVMRQGTHAGIYAYLACRAEDLIHNLDTVWHAWNNAGERLIYPLTNRDKISNPSGDYVKLLMEHRDFKTLYGHHLIMVRSQFTDFNSGTMEIGYPSEHGYVDVRAALVMHAEALKTKAKKSWEKYGSPLDE